MPTLSHWAAYRSAPNPRSLDPRRWHTLYVSRFITPALPGESTATVTTTPTRRRRDRRAAQLAMSFTRTIVLQHSDKADFENQGRGIPNYLGAATISPDGSQAWVPSKQDNIKRGALRDGTGLNFQNTVRAVSSRIVLATNQEDLTKRIDHDNASVASAAASTGVVSTCSWRWRPVVSGRGGYPLGIPGDALHVGGRRRAWHSRATATRCTSTTSWTAPSACTTCSPCSWAVSSACRWCPS